MNFVLRNKTLHLRKRVPKRYERVEERQFVWLSLHTDSEAIAKVKAPKVWADMIEAWEAKLDGDTSDAEARFAAARDLAGALGYRFLDAKRVAELPLPELMDRVAIAMKASRPGNPAKIEAEALLGGAKEPAITISRAMEIFFEVAKDNIRGKSKDQIRRWEAPRKKAIKNFIEVNGDIAGADLDADHMLNFVDWWSEKLETEGLTPNSANKDITYLSGILRTVNKKKRFGWPLPLSGYAFKEGEKRHRPPFSPEWIKTKILAPGALSGMNTEARCILLGMINTGYRPSEGAALLPAHIRTDVDIPHIEIMPEGRTLKSQYSKRVIPLVGVSLDAFKECKGGFPRYRDKAGISATVNSFLRENGLLETDGHTMYGLRHSFEDRLLAAKVDERIRRDLFGHSLNRERYGDGASLKHLHEIVQGIAL